MTSELKRSKLKSTLMLCAALMFATCTLSTPVSAAGNEGGGAFKSQKKKPVKRKPARKKSIKRTRTINKGGAASRRSCVRIRVQVARTKSNGNRWDVDGKNNRPRPDIFITNLANRRKSGVCENSFSCSWTIRNPGSVLKLSVTDKDIVAHDLIGRGTCSVNASRCRLGRASLRLSGC